MTSQLTTEIEISFEQNDAILSFHYIFNTDVWVTWIIADVITFRMEK